VYDKDRKTINCGRFDTVEEAKVARAIKESELGYVRVFGKVYNDGNMEPIRNEVRARSLSAMKDIDRMNARDLAGVIGCITWRLRWGLKGYEKFLELSGNCVVKKTYTGENLQENLTTNKKKGKKAA